MANPTQPIPPEGIESLRLLDSALVDVVRVGRCKYRLKTPTTWCFVPGTDSTLGRFEVKSFVDIVIGRGNSLASARKDWENRLHANFQELYHAQNAEMEKPKEDLWKKLSCLIDVEAYRKSVSIVGREIGKVIKTGSSGKLVMWQNEKREVVHYERAPGEFVNISAGEWFEVMVARHPDTYKIRRILWIKPYTPWAPWEGSLDDAHKAKLESIPTIASLPETSWD